MEDYKIKANEEFFRQTIGVLREGGVYGWVETGHIYTLRSGKLTGDQKALDQVRKIVSEEFFKKFFGISQK